MQLPIKHCLHCGIILRLTKTRDINRKKYCGYSCRQKHRWDMGEMRWFDQARLLGNIAEANQKKGLKLSAHPKWNPDRASLKYRPGPEKKAWKQAVLERDGYVCQECGTKDGRIIADHIKPYAAFPELRFDVSNGRALCEPCHRKTPTYTRKRKYQLAVFQ